MVAASTPQELNDPLQYDFNLISSWYINKKLTLNVKKTYLMLAENKTMLSQFDNFLFFSELI